MKPRNFPSRKALRQARAVTRQQATKLIREALGSGTPMPALPAMPKGQPHVRDIRWRLGRARRAAGDGGI